MFRRSSARCIRSFSIIQLAYAGARPPRGALVDELKKNSVLHSTLDAPADPSKPITFDVTF
jgi:hypothetical protein